jgi:hypothetical protein
MDTQFIAGNNPGSTAGNILLAGGVGATNGNVIIAKRTDLSAGKLEFQGTGASTATVSLMSGEMPSSITFKLPTSTGLPGQMLSTDGANPAQLTFISTGSTVSSLNDLSDVSITAPTLNNFLKYNGTEWVNSNITNILAFGDLTDVTITAPTTSQLVNYNGTQWVNTNISTAINITQLGGVNITSVQPGEVLGYDGTNWVNRPVQTYERITAVGGGPNVSPDVRKNTTMIKTTGTGNATGILEDGLSDGMVKHLIATDLAFSGTTFTPYTLDVSTNTIFKDANGITTTNIKFNRLGNAISIFWDGSKSNWNIMGSGVEIN